MPSIRVSNLSRERIKTLSKELTQPLADVIGCPKDWLSFGVRDEVLYCDGEQMAQDVIVYVEWFDRPKETKDKVAVLITKALSGTLSEAGAVISCVTVLFTVLDSQNFYENGSSI